MFHRYEIVRLSLRFVVFQIKLSTKSFGRDAATVAAKGIANIANTLEEADLSDIIAGESPAGTKCPELIESKL